MNGQSDGVLRYCEVELAIVRSRARIKNLVTRQALGEDVEAQLQAERLFRRKLDQERANERAQLTPEEVIFVDNNVYQGRTLQQARSGLVDLALLTLIIAGTNVVSFAVDGGYLWVVHAVSVVMNLAGVALVLRLGRRGVR